MKLSNLKPTKHPTRETFEIWGNSLYHFLSFCPNPILGNSHFHSSFDTRRQTVNLFINVLTKRRIPIFPKPSSSHFGLTLVCLSSRADHPNPIAIFWKPSTKPKLSHIFIFLHQMWNFFKVSGNLSGVSSCFGLINHKWVFHLRIRLAIEKILGSKVLYFGVCCILINFHMNEDKGNFVLVKEIFRWTHLFLNRFLYEFKATQFSLLFFWIYFFNLFCLFFFVFVPRNMLIWILFLFLFISIRV